jgi:hypothetical protein
MVYTGSPTVRHSPSGSKFNCPVARLDYSIPEIPGATNYTWNFPGMVNNFGTGLHSVVVQRKSKLPEIRISVTVAHPWKCYGPPCCNSWYFWLSTQDRIRQFVPEHLPYSSMGNWWGDQCQRCYMDAIPAAADWDPNNPDGDLCGISLTSSIINEVLLLTMAAKRRHMSCATDNVILLYYLINCNNCCVGNNPICSEVHQS